MNLFALSGILIGSTSIAMAALMLFIGKERLHYIWSLFCVSVAIWGFGGYKIATTMNAEEADFWWRITHIGIIFIPVLFLHFTYRFLEKKERLHLWLAYLAGCVFLAANLWGNLFIANMRWVFNQFYYDSPPGPLYIPFTFFFVGLVIYSHRVLWQALKTSEGLKRRQIQYFFIGMFVSFAGGSLSLLPVYGIDLYPVLNILAFLYTPILTYAILRTHLFDIRTMLTQLLVGFITFLLLINFLASRTFFEYSWKGLLLVVFLFAGYILIKSVLREVEYRERLQEAYAALEKLDKAKSEFMSIASHQLRTPLSVIKGYVSLMQEGSFGAMADKQKQVMDKLYATNENMLRLVDDLLNTTRAEEGRLQYSFEKTDLRNLVEAAVKNLELNAKEKGLSLRGETPPDPVFAQVDKDKLMQVISNLIDNAIKYTDQGEIRVRLSAEPATGRAVISVSDTGLGIAAEELAHLFGSFSRGKAGRKSWTKGTGLGLYIARQFTQAHKGRIWAESAGEKKGSTFFIELPLC